MSKEEILIQICNCFDYNYKIYEDGRVVIDDGLGTDHTPTTEWIGGNFCGHLEYASIDTMLLDWLMELKNGTEAKNCFQREIAFIENMKV